MLTGSDRPQAERHAGATVKASLDARLREICDPEAVDRQAFEDQALLIESHGGREAAIGIGAPGATPVPTV